MPTQMGRTESPFTSFRMTMGMLVTGSIISPRIFISTSGMVPPLCGLAYHLAQQTVRKACADVHSNVTTRLRNCVTGGGGEVQRFVLRSAADVLSASRILAFNHHFKCLPQMTCAQALLYLLLMLLEDRKTARF